MSDAATRLQILSAAARTLGEAGLDVRRVLDAIAAQATSLFADSCTITLVADDGAHLEIVAATDRDPEARAFSDSIARTQRKLRLDEGIAGEVIRRGEPFVIERVDEDRILGQVSDAYRDYVQRYPMKSVVVVPLRARSVILGTLAVVRRSGDPFTTQDVDLMCDVADQAALALDNARLFNRAEVLRADAEAALLRAENAIRARDNTLAVVSHDLRNPLSAIKLQAEMLARNEASTIRKRADIILRSAKGMERLIADLFDIAQLEAGAVHLDTRTYDLRTLLEHAADLLATTLEPKQQRLVVTACEARVRVDRDRFVQVLSNLVGNANKFAPEGSTISLHALRVGEELEIRVIDQGPGIPRELRTSVFERFVQTATGAARKLGVGLGLAIAKGLVEAQGGRITVDDATGGGAMFRIALPVVASQPRPDERELASFYGIGEDAARALLRATPDDPRWTAGPAAGIAVMEVQPGGAHAGSNGFLVRIAEGATYPTRTRPTSTSSSSPAASATTTAPRSGKETKS